MVREEELAQKAKEVREALIAMAADEIDATHIEVGQIKAKDDARKLVTVRVAGANRYVPYAGHDTSEFTVGDYWAIIFDDYGTIRLGWWVSNNAGGGTIPSGPHASTHEDGGADEISVAALSGLLADDQHVLDAEVLAVAAALAHKDTHKSGGADAFAAADLHESIIKRLQETGGPTTLLMGAVADGEYLRRTGAGIVGGPGGSGLYSDYVHIREEQPSGTAGGDFVQGAWRTRVLNQELSDTGGDAALAGNQITLEAGTYRCRISCPAHSVKNHKSRLWNITDGVTLLVGTQLWASAVDSVNNVSIIVGRFTLAAQKVLEVQHYCLQTKLVFGLGGGSGFGEVEIYTEVELWKEV